MDKVAFILMIVFSSVVHADICSGQTSESVEIPVTDYQLGFQEAQLAIEYLDKSENPLGEFTVEDFNSIVIAKASFLKLKYERLVLEVELARLRKHPSSGIEDKAIVVKQKYCDFVLNAGLHDI